MGLGMPDVLLIYAPVSCSVKMSIISYEEPSSERTCSVCSLCCSEFGSSIKFMVVDGNKAAVVYLQ